MNNLTFKVIIRSLLKKKFLTGIQIGGLVIGFAIVLFLMEKINFERGYDSFWTGHSSIYRVGLDVSYEDGRTIRSAKNFHGASELLDAEIPGVRTHCNIGKDVVTIFNEEQKIQDVDWFWADTTFFSVFDRKIILAESNNILSDIHGIAVSESFAKKLFGNANPLNKEITVNEGWKYTIQGVFEDVPSNSHLKIDAIGSYASLNYYMRHFDNTKQILVDNPDYVYQVPSPYTQGRWRTPVQYRPHCYIRLAPNVQISEIEANLQASLKKVGLPPDLQKSKMNFIFQPVASIHLNSKLDDELGANGSTMQINFLLIIGVVVLLICLVNFLNLSTISTLEERKGYSISLLNGSPKSNILFILMFRNFVLFLIALGIAVPVAIWLISSQIPGTTISGISLAILFVVVAIGSFSTAFIPYISIFSTPVFITLKGQSQGLQQNWSSRKALVILQFAITIVLVISTIGIYRQMNFMMKEKLGFSGNQTVFSYTPMTMNGHPEIPTKLLTFKNEVLALPEISSFCVSSTVPGKTIVRSRENVAPQNASEPYASVFNEISIDEKFAATYNIPLISGENLNEHSNWQSDEVLINRSASKIMGFTNPMDAIGSSFAIGQNKYKVKGVLEDYHHESLHNQIKPTVYIQNLIWDKGVGYYSFKLNTSNISETMRKVGAIWKKLYPKEEFLFYFSNKEFEAQYQSDVKFNQVLSYSAMLALVISCLGLLSLAMFNTKQRIKEIGVRKVNGARISEVILLLNRDFIKWVAISFVIAVPIAYFAMHKWLESFAYKTTLSWWIFALAGVLALGIALLTVSWHSWRAASRNPVEALRYE